MSSRNEVRMGEDSHLALNRFASFQLMGECGIDDQ